LPLLKFQPSYNTAKGALTACRIPTLPEPFPSSADTDYQVSCLQWLGTSISRNQHINYSAVYNNFKASHKLRNGHTQYMKQHYQIPSNNNNRLV